MQTLVVELEDRAAVEHVLWFLKQVPKSRVELRGQTPEKTQKSLKAAVKKVAKADAREYRSLEGTLSDGLWEKEH